MKKILFLLLCILITGTGLIAAQETEAVSENNTENEEAMTLEEFEKRMEEEIQIYENRLKKMNGSMSAYYMIYDYMGRGYVMLDADLIIQIEDFDALSSKKFTITFSGKDDMGFSLNKKWTLNKDEVFVNPEGDGVMVLRFNMEKGVYSDIQITVNGDKGDNAAVTVDKYETLQLSDLMLKLSRVFLISDVNGVQRNEFFRRRYFVVPNIRGYYENNMQLGFYFEYFHLSVDALYKEGRYTVEYSIVFTPSDYEVYNTTEERDEVGENGQYIMYLPDVSNLITGVYRIDYTFTDQNTKEEFKGSLYFRLINPENEMKTTTEVPVSEETDGDA